MLPEDHNPEASGVIKQNLPPLEKLLLKETP